MSADAFAPLPAPPYYAVVFASRRTAVDAADAATAERMLAMTAQQPGFLGVDSARDAAGFGITLSYRDSEAAIADPRRHAEHTLARGGGPRDGYEHCTLRVARVERACAWDKDSGA